MYFESTTNIDPAYWFTTPACILRRRDLVIISTKLKLIWNAVLYCHCRPRMWFISFEYWFRLRWTSASYIEQRANGPKRTACPPWRQYQAMTSWHGLVIEIKKASTVALSFSFYSIFPSLTQRQRVGLNDGRIITLAYLLRDKRWENLITAKSLSVGAVLVSEFRLSFKFSSFMCFTFHKIEFYINEKIKT